MQNTDSSSGLPKGGEGKVVEYDQLLSDLGGMVKGIYSDIESKINSKLEEVAKKMEEVQEEMRKHQEEESKKFEEVRKSIPKFGSPSGFDKSVPNAKLEEEEKHEARRVVYKPIFVSQSTSKASYNEEDLRKRREERGRKLEEYKRKMEERRKKLAYEAARTPTAQGKAQTSSTTDTPQNSDSTSLVPNPLGPNSSIPEVPRWEADLLKAQASTDKRVVG